MAESGEVDAVASGQASARGSACSMERTIAELLDTARRCRDGGGHVYDGEVVAVASAMAEGSEGEALGESERVQAVEGATWRSTSMSRG